MNAAKNIYQFVIVSICLLALTLACGQTPSVKGVETDASVTLVPATILPLPTVVPGDQVHTLSSGGLERSYLLHIPPGYDATQPTPLVLAYHGIGLNAQEMARISGFSAQADQENFIVAYPNGTGSRQSWNGGECCGESMIKRVDDVGFTRALIDDVAELLNIDRKRIYATGFSNGAIMVYRLACDLADQIAAIGPVGAAPATQICNPSRAVSVIHFHGDADRLNPYEGGEGIAGPAEFMPVEEGISMWASLNGCPASPKELQSGNIVYRLFAPCQGDTAIELYKILGGEHAWPGGEAVSAEVGEPTDEIDATKLMWGFFLAHALP